MRKGKKIKYDGLQFQSGLEKYCYIQLKANKLFEGYESETFRVMEGFSLPNEIYAKTSAGKGEYKLRTGVIRPIDYTPDFIGRDYIIECKGWPNEAYPLRKKLFLQWLKNNKIGKAFFEPRNRKDVDQTIDLIKINRKK